MSSGEGPAGVAPSADRPERGEATQSNGIHGGLGWVLGQGYKVLPIYSVTGGVCHCSRGERCEAPGKHPMTRNGLKDASGEPSVVREWWLRWPDANWAVRTGDPNGPTVVDIDPRNGGFESIERFELDERGEPLPATLTVSTGGGGRHLWFAPSATRTRGNWRPGVDVKGLRGYVLLPGSAHASGGTYRWLNFEEWSRRPLPGMPEDVQGLLQTGVGRSNRAGGTGRSSVIAKTGTLLERGLAAGSRDDGFQSLAWRETRYLYPDKAAVIAVMRRVWEKTAQPASDKYPWERAAEKVERAFAALGPEIEQQRAWERGLRRRTR